MSDQATPDIVSVLSGMQATLDDLRAELSAVHAELRAKPAAPAVPRLWYSVDEAAGLLGKRPYTVREWCRYGQINASKRIERRGCSALWSVSSEEIERYRNEGLLPINPSRNNVN